MKGHCPDLLRPVELPPLPGSLRWQAHPHQGTRELWLRVLQLQGVQLDCTPCPGRWQLQVPIGEVGAGGASSDAQIWNTCSLKEAIDDETIGIPPDEPLPHDDRDIPYFVIGDAAFALRTTLMKPFGAKPLTMEEMIFNYRLSRARRCVENAFGILANRFRCLLSAMAQVPSTVETIVLAYLCIHNLLRDQAPAEQNAMMDKEDDQHSIIPCAWREGTVLDDMQKRLAGNYITKIAKRQRLYLKHYYNGTAGAILWQQRMA